MTSDERWVSCMKIDQKKSRVIMIQNLEATASPSCENCEMTIAGVMFRGEMGWEWRSEVL